MLCRQVQKKVVSWPTSKTDGFVARSVEIWELFLKDEISLYWMKPSCFFQINLSQVRNDTIIV